MSKATDTQWRVQVRKSRNHAWTNRSGLFETREDAREQAVYMRVGRMCAGQLMPGTGYGFGNTRVIPYVKPQKVRG